MANENLGELSIREILQRIRTGQLNPLMLSKTLRQACVETLLLEGYQQAAIAQFLKKSDRTIRRDMEDIRKSYSAKPSFEFTRLIIADFLFQARIHQAHLMRLARSGESSTADKSRAEGLAWKVSKEVLQELYYIGFLIMGNEFTKKRVDVASDLLSEKEKRILEECDHLDPLSRDTLIDRLTRELLKVAEEKSQEECQDQKVSEVKEG